MEKTIQVLGLLDLILSPELPSLYPNLDEQKCEKGQRSSVQFDFVQGLGQDQDNGQGQRNKVNSIAAQKCIFWKNSFQGPKYQR